MGHCCRFAGGAVGRGPAVLCRRGDLGRGGLRGHASARVFDGRDELPKTEIMDSWTEAE